MLCYVILGTGKPRSVREHLVLATQGEDPPHGLDIGKKIVIVFLYIENQRNHQLRQLNTKRKIMSTFQIVAE